MMMTRTEFNTMLDEEFPDSYSLTESQITALYTILKHSPVEEAALQLAQLRETGTNPWQWISALRAREQEQDKGRCAWVTEGRRCYLAGTVSPSTTGGGPWYCAFHMEHVFFARPVHWEGFQRWYQRAMGQDAHATRAQYTMADLWEAIIGKTRLPHDPDPQKADLLIDEEWDDALEKKALELMGTLWQTLKERSVLVTRTPRQSS